MAVENQEFLSVAKVVIIHQFLHLKDNLAEYKVIIVIQADTAVAVVLSKLDVQTVHHMAVTVQLLQFQVQQSLELAAVAVVIVQLVLH